MILYTTILTYVRDEIKKLSQRYADRLEKHLDTLAIDEWRRNTTQIEGKITSRLVYLTVL